LSFTAKFSPPSGYKKAGVLPPADDPFTHHFLNGHPLFLRLVFCRYSKHIRGRPEIPDGLPVREA